MYIPDDVPNATLNYMFFGENFEFDTTMYNGYDFDVMPIGTAENNWVMLTLEKVANRKGYLFVYTANESPGDKVYFDDLKITHIEHPVVQYDDYNLGGDTFNSYVSGVANKYLYQNKELISELDLDIFDFEWRGLDRKLMRTWQIDPMAEKFYSQSPYSWALNNPMRFIDPDGREAKDNQQEHRSWLAGSRDRFAKRSVGLSGTSMNSGESSAGRGQSGDRSNKGKKEKKSSGTISKDEDYISNRYWGSPDNGVDGLLGEAERRQASGVPALPASEEGIDWLKLVGEILFGSDDRNIIAVGIGDNPVSLFVMGAGAVEVMNAAKGGVTFFRAMSNAEYAALNGSGGLAHLAGKELFVSTQAAYSRAYLQKSGYDVLVKFNMKPGALNYFNEVGVFHRTAAASSGWAGRGNLLWKSEGGVWNLGIQQNTHLFNPWIKNFKKIR